MTAAAPDLLVLAAEIAQLAGEDEEFLLSWLPQAQAEAIRRNRRGEDRCRRLLVRILLAFGLHLVASWSPQQTLAALSTEKEGRPFLRGCPWEIGFSHAGKWAVCVLGKRTVTGQVGVDVEEVRRLSVDELAPVFSGPERRAIRAAADPSTELIRRWTVKEAVLKARGTGFLEDPRGVETGPPSTKGEAWGCCWEQIPLDEGYWLTVAARLRWTGLGVIRPQKEEWRPLFGA